MCLLVSGCTFWFPVVPSGFRMCLLVSGCAFSFQDVFRRVVRAEGFFSLWKGFTPYYARLGPHTVLTFIFLEQMNVYYKLYVLKDTSKGGSSLWGAVASEGVGGDVRAVRLRSPYVSVRSPGRCPSGAPQHAAMGAFRMFEALCKRRPVEKSERSLNLKRWYYNICEEVRFSTRTKVSRLEARNLTISVLERQNAEVSPVRNCRSSGTYTYLGLVICSGFQRTSYCGLERLASGCVGLPLTQSVV